MQWYNYIYYLIWLNQTKQNETYVFTVNVPECMLIIMCMRIPCQVGVEKRDNIYLSISTNDLHYNAVKGNSAMEAGLKPCFLKLQAMLNAPYGQHPYNQGDFALSNEWHLKWDDNVAH